MTRRSTWRLSRAISSGRVVALLVLTAALYAPAALGQGKIAGTVTDGNNGDPLIGVNVLIAGTMQGTVTDVNGDYIILNVRPGDYSLVYSYIGFKKQTVSGVRVSTGQTTRYDVRLTEQVFEGEEIIVQAERPLVQRDLTASKKTVVAEEIASLPVESFFGVLLTQAGVNTGPSGEIHIRGGRSNEVAYLVDGMSVGNPFNTNGLATSVSTDAIQEMTVISGAFNAEYGKAMSGIVNLVTKEGGDQYTGSISAWGGSTVTANDDVFFTPSGVGMRNYTLEGSLSGPVPFWKKLRFFASVRHDDDEGHIYGKREHSPGDSANFNVDPWYYELQGTPVSPDDVGPVDAETVPMNPSKGTNFIGKLSTRPFSGTKIEYSFLLDKDEWTPFDFADRFNPDGLASNYDLAMNHSLHWTHTLNERTFYTLRVSYQKQDFESYLYKCDEACRAGDTPVDPRYVSTGSILGFPGNNFTFGGDDKGHVYESSRTFRGKFDVTKQFGTIHEARAGLEAELTSLDRENFVVLYDNDQFRRPTVPSLESPLHDKYVNQDVQQIAAYAQDKLEFDNFIINAGVRVEHFRPNGFTVGSLLNPPEPGLDQEQTNARLLAAGNKTYVLPRIGVSFPITNRGILHFSYGHFAQMPPLRNMYVNPEFEFGAGETPTFGNANMRPERAVQYEIGLQQQISDQLAFDVTGFFKDIRDYLAPQNVQFSTISGQSNYAIYLNKDYANVRGVTFALTKRRSRNGLLSATIDYTFQNAEGNNNDAGAFFFNFLSGRETELEIVPLDFDQRHIVSSTVTLTKPGNWNVSFIGSFSTGYPYTPSLIDQKLDQLPNQGRKPTQIDLDATVSKQINIDRFSVRLFAKVFNALDRLNERFVFDETGRASYSLNERLNVHAPWKSLYGQPGIHTLEEWDTRPQWYSRPREIKIGATLSF
ncbi:MAG: TonB-dependent receptor plug domain-containing protein [Rhodothermales bacterium]|nr:TonB-dependent receptor plug domain-containing protein [Rhodothermales bacterium]